MTGRTVRVTVEWALRGKTSNDWEYRILGCSDGDLHRRNFEEALDRYSPGTLDDLPQVSVNYLVRADRADGAYLALAIRELAEGQRDANNREIISTRYFCVPYAQLAADAISYQVMYEAFRALPLPLDDGPAVRAELAVPPWQVPPADNLACQTASLLLDGPVCVLGAAEISIVDRLRFIDTVMSLLPYGMRSRMSASTWTSSTYQTHRFRLFFSNAERVNDGKDQAVVWGQPEPGGSSPGRGYAHDYLAWLKGNAPDAVPRLAGMTDALGFGARQILQMLELAGVPGQRPEPDKPAGVPGQRPDPDNVPGVAGQQPDRDEPAGRRDLLSALRLLPPERATDAETVLLDCVSQIRPGNLVGLRSSLTQLRTYADNVPATDDRKRYQDIIAEHRLLRPDLPIGRLDGRFYDVLLRLAFGTPLSYRGYCLLESCLGRPAGEAPHRPLLKAIERGGMADARVMAIVLRQLDESKLSNWLESGEIDVIQLINWLAEEGDRLHHTRIVCDVTLQYLHKRPEAYDQRAVLAALRGHGYLAHTLQLRHPGDPEYQEHVTSQLLRAAYGGQLDRTAAEEILAGTPKPPTPALLGAVLLQLGDPAADAASAKEAFVTGLLRSTEFSPETRARLERFIAGHDPAPGPSMPRSRPLWRQSWSRLNG